jgi:NADH dehydrogenase
MHSQAQEYDDLRDGWVALVRYADHTGTTGPNNARCEQLTAALVIGSGFAGLWAALGAARRLDELAIPAGTVDITVLATQAFHDIRVRNYEADLRQCRIPLAELLDPVGVAHVATEVDRDRHRRPHRRHIGWRRV